MDSCVRVPFVGCLFTGMVLYVLDNDSVEYHWRGLHHGEY
jgi:hypothetical protein